MHIMSPPAPGGPQAFPDVDSGEVEIVEWWVPDVIGDVECLHIDVQLIEHILKQSREVTKLIH